ncbi:MAG: hypothetical protein ACREFD_00935 [Stellaceae bacterium]
MADAPGPLKLYQIEEPDGAPADAGGIGLAVGIELSRLRGVTVAVAVGGNAELVVVPEAPFMDELMEQDLAALLIELRGLTEKTVARPVTHAVIRLEGFALADAAVLQAAAAADIAVMGIRREGGALEAAIEAEDLAAQLSD